MTFRKGHTHLSIFFTHKTRENESENVKKHHLFDYFNDFHVFYDKKCVIYDLDSLPLQHITEKKKKKYLLLYKLTLFFSRESEM